MRVIREDGASGRFANVWFENGQADTDNPGALAYFRRRDGYSMAEQPAAPAAAPAQPEQAPGRPDESDRKAAWTAYAEHVGVDPDGLTKDELIDAVKEAGG